MPTKLQHLHVQVTLSPKTFQTHTKHIIIHIQQCIHCTVTNHATNVPKPKVGIIEITSISFTIATTILSVACAMDGSGPPVAHEIPNSLASIKQYHAKCFHLRCAKQAVFTMLISVKNLKRERASIEPWLDQIWRSLGRASPSAMSISKIEVR